MLPSTRLLVEDVPLAAELAWLDVAMIVPMIVQLPVINAAPIATGIFLIDIIHPWTQQYEATDTPRMAAMRLAAPRRPVGLFGLFTNIVAQRMTSNPACPPWCAWLMS